MQTTTLLGERRAHGWVAPGFEDVRTQFERNFRERGEIGAAVAAYWRGKKIVDLWGGHRTVERLAPWKADTMAVVMSTTKGLAAMTFAVARSRGWLDYDAPVARYWPEFAQNGKARISVRQLLSHEAGLVVLDEDLGIERMRDLDDVARVLARQKPQWPPGTRHGYHAMTIGLYMQEILRRADPARRTLGRVFHEEIAEPLGLDFYIGLPSTIPSSRVAEMRTFTRARAVAALVSTPPALIERALWPWSLLNRSMLFSDLKWRDRVDFEVELPAGNGVGTARSIARAYSTFAEGGDEIGIDRATFDEIVAPPNDAVPAKDVVLGLRAHYSLGWMRPGPDLVFGSSPRAFGTPGAGGSFGFADPDARLGYAYVMNKMQFHPLDDPREKPLRDAIYRAIVRQASS